MRSGLSKCDEGKSVVDLAVEADERAIRRDEGRFRRCQ